MCSLLLDDDVVRSRYRQVSRIGAKARAECDPTSPTPYESTTHDARRRFPDRYLGCVRLSLVLERASKARRGGDHGRLNVGDVFPEFKVTNVDGREFSLPTDLAGDYAIVLFYRAWW